MRLLLDTCAVAELRKPRPDAAVVAAVKAVADENLFLSALSVGEIVKGIGLLAAGKKRNELSAWLAELENEFAKRILPVEAEIAKLWGDMAARAQKKGIVIAPIDGLIAATALKYRLQVLTRNEKDFRGTGVRVVNPWSTE